MYLHTRLPQYTTKRTTTQNLEQHTKQDGRFHTPKTK